MIAEAKKIYKDDVEVVDINIKSREGQLAARAHNVTATPTIKINNKIKFRGEPKSKEDLFGEIENYMDKESIDKAEESKRKYKKRVNMMYS